MAMAYYQSDRFQSRHVRPDVSVDDEDKHLDHSRSEEVLRVRATHEPSETVFATKQTKPKLRGVRLGSFVCGCFGGDWVYDGMEGGSSLKSNSVRAPPTDSTSAASDGTPFDNADSLGSEPDVFEQHAVIGAELTAAHMQPLPSTGFADGMVPQQAYYQQSVFDVSAPAPTLLSHRSLQAGRPAPMQRTATYSPGSRHAGPPSAFQPRHETIDCDLPEVSIPQEVSLGSHCHSSPARLQRHQTLSAPPSPPAYHAVQPGGISHAYLPAANTVCVRYQPARLTRCTTLA